MPPEGESPRPAAHLSGFSPVFRVRDVRRALAHYESLGFVTKAYAEGEGYGFAQRDGTGLHLERVAELAHHGDVADGPGHDAHEHADGPGHDAHELADRPDHGPSGFGCSAAYLYVDDADALHGEWSRPGLHGVTRPVGLTACGLREGSHVDPDGNVIRFGSPAAGMTEGRLSAHLEARYGIGVERISELDVGVYHVERSDGPNWVARMFPERRTVDAAQGDASILAYLATVGFPAERLAAVEPVSKVDGRAVLVTEHVEGVPRGRRQAAIRDVGGLHRLGELLGSLHSLQPGADVTGREGGAWHHLADGSPAAEIDAASDLLGEAAGLVGGGERRLYDSLRRALDDVDACEGLPQAALVHPDFVLANVVASPDHGMVLVDWTGAGRGPRLWPLAFLLFAEGTKNLPRVDLVATGYRRHVGLEAEELARLGGVVGARPVVFNVWSFCMGRKSLADAAAGIAASAEQSRAIAARARSAFRPGA